MAWKLWQAKRFNRFIDWLNNSIAPLLIDQLKQEFEQSRNEQYPNKPCHVELSIAFYKKYPVRIFEAAVEREIIEPDWFENNANKRFAAHLLFIQGQYRLQKSLC